MYSLLGLGEGIIEIEGVVMKRLIVIVTEEGKGQRCRQRVARQDVSIRQ